MASWDHAGRVERMLRQAGGEPSNAGVGESNPATYQGRPIIKRDSRINGGVSVGIGREAIVVDFERDRALTDMYRSLKRKWDAKRHQDPIMRCYNWLNGKFPRYPGDPERLVDRLYASFAASREAAFEAYVLETTHRAVDAAFTKRTDEEVAAVVGPGSDGTKISIDDFLLSGTGNCRHINLAAAAILERACDESYLGGSVSMDRNTTENGGHGWARYTPAKGKPLAVDPCLGFLGPIDDPRAPHDYRRPED